MTLQEAAAAGVLRQIGSTCSFFVCRITSNDRYERTRRSSASCRRVNSANSGMSSTITVSR